LGLAKRSRQSFSILAIVFLAVSLAGCASRPESGFLSAVAYSPQGAVDHTLLVATTRERDNRPGTLFNGDRASAIDYAELTISIPPNHKQNEIEWAATPPGYPNVNFVVRDEKYLDGDKAFLQTVNAQLALRPPGSRNVFLFVHGFNTMFASTAARSSLMIRKPPASRCCSPGRRADRRPPTSMTSTARPPRATRSSTHCVSCFAATPKRSMFSPIRWAIG
jgi:hypothetical protein